MRAALIRLADRVLFGWVARIVDRDVTRALEEFDRDVDQALAIVNPPPATVADFLARKHREGS